MNMQRQRKALTSREPHGHGHPPARELRWWAKNTVDSVSASHNSNEGVTTSATPEGCWRYSKAFRARHVAASADGRFFSLAMRKKRFFRAQSSHSTKNCSPAANAG